MLRLRDIMTPDVVTVGPDLTLRDAMELLTRLHISGAPVVSRGKVVGVISLTDLADFAASTPGVPTQRPELEDGDAFDEPMEWLDGDEPSSAFFVDQWEDWGADVVERIAETTGREWNVLEEHTVSEAMNRKVASLSTDTSVQQAADVMRRAAIHRILVMEGGRLLGVVTTKDISDAVADHQLTTRVYVFDRKAP